VLDDTGWNNGPMDAQRAITDLTAMVIRTALPHPEWGAKR